RAQMGSSLAFHICFSVLGIGMPVALLIAEGLWLRTKNDVYRQLARTWSKAFAVTFGIGAVSGTMLSFELGLLWPRFMEFAGGIIGMPFSLEGFAFFIEAIFLALYLYGWNRLTPRAHFLCGIPLLIGGFASTFFIVSANSWMNTPQGFTVDANGSITDIDPVAAMFNPAFPTQYFHMLFAALVCTGFAIAAVYAAGMLRGRKDEYHRKGLAIGLVFAAIVLPIQLVTGDLIAVQVTQNQPLKLATMEGLYKTTKSAPLTLFGIPDNEKQEVVGGIEIPYLLSILAYNSPTATVQGMDAFPKENWPNTVMVHTAYDLMITIGSGLMLPGLIALYAWRRRPRWLEHKLFLAMLVACGPAAYICLETGWITTESGRQPWAIYNVLKVEDSVTSASGILGWFILFSIVYLVITVLMVSILLRMARKRRQRLAAADVALAVPGD
ncbi:MAG: cytochrome ubiquinol oxidase subunit I, partial [Thermoleophilia bacterium]